MQKIHANPKRTRDNAMPETDESWWESLLAEEVRKTAAANRNNGVPASLENFGRTRSQDVQTASLQHDVDWERAKELYSADRIIEVTAVGFNRGGVLVEGDGIPGFIPFSHLIEFTGKGNDLDRERWLEKYNGKTLDVKVIECVPEEARLVFSERAALSEPGRRVELFNNLQTGTVVHGVVTNITEFGAFVDLGGVEGLIHISELSWGRVLHPEQIVRLGEAVDVLVLEISVARNRVALSLKRMHPNPWEGAGRELAAGQILCAEITEVLSYGAFARLPSGLEGLIHSSEMTLANNQNPRDVLLIGQKVDVRIIHLDPDHKKMGLSLKI